MKFYSTYRCRKANLLSRGQWGGRGVLAILLILLTGTLQLTAQFAPAAGLPGSTAIYRDSSILKAWATGCILQRGWQNIADTTLGKTTVGDETSATGMANTNGVISLGDGGAATLTFANPIANGPGFDFAVFENGFPTGTEPLAFLEFAFVEVSSDGINFTRFPATSNIQDTAQMAMQGIDCALVNNLAGKYINGYGTPFDLEELKDKPGLDVNHITHVKVIDVVGAVNPAFATYDKDGRKINDPYPTAFASSGFDLDAVGVIYQIETGIQELALSSITLYPNPAKDVLNIATPFTTQPTQATIFNINGAAVLSSVVRGPWSINTSTLPAGIYMLHLRTSTQTATAKFAVE